VMFVVQISDGDHANYQGKETMNLVNSRHFSAAFSVISTPILFTSHVNRVLWVSACVKRIE
jgi:hypothetical protein